MKLLVVNPNISESVTRLIGDEARRAASPGTSMTVLTAPFGVAYIETRLEAIIGAYACLTLLAEKIADHDGVVVAAFGDPGVPGLREAFGVPLVGLTEAALASASLLGARFSIVSISRRMEPWYRDSIERCGMAGRMASLRFLDAAVRDIGGVQQEQSEKLKALCLEAVRHDGAEVIVLAGAPLAGLARTIAAQVPVPLVDGVASAVQQCEALVRRGARPAPIFPPKATAGLPSSLESLLGGRTPGA